MRTVQTFIIAMAMGMTSLLSGQSTATETAVQLPQLDYSDELKRYEFEIEVRAFQALKEELDAHKYAESLKITGPIHPAVMTQDQVRLQIADELKRIVEEQFPNSRYTEIKNEAEQLYKMYKVGERITIKRHYGGQQLEVDGLLEVISTDLVKISSLPVPKVDIAKDDLARIFWAEHEDAIQKYIRKQTRIFEENRKTFSEKQKNLISNKLWLENGYVRNKKTRRWVPIQDVFMNKYEREKDSKLNSLRTEIRKEVYQENNFVHVPERGGWIRESDLVVETTVETEDATFLGKVKTFFKTKKESDSDIEKSGVVKVTDESSNATPAGNAEDESDLWDADDFQHDSGESGDASPGDKPADAPPAPKKEDVSDLFDEFD